MHARSLDPAEVLLHLAITAYVCMLHCLGHPTCTKLALKTQGRAPYFTSEHDVFLRKVLFATHSLIQALATYRVLW